MAYFDTVDKSVMTEQEARAVLGCEGGRFVTEADEFAVLSALEARQMVDGLGCLLAVWGESFCMPTVLGLCKARTAVRRERSAGRSV